MNTATNSSDNTALDLRAPLPGCLIGNGIHVEVTETGWVARRKVSEEIRDGLCFSSRTVGIETLASGPQTDQQHAYSAAMFKVGQVERLRERAR